MIKLTLELPLSHVVLRWDECDKIVKVHPYGRTGPSIVVEPCMASLKVLNSNVRGGMYIKDYRILQDTLQTIGNRVRYNATG